MVYQRFQIDVAKAAGTSIWSTAGTRYLDFTSGIATLNTGHRHPGVLRAMEQQMAKATHVAQHVYGSELRKSVAARLTSLTPHLDRAVFSCSGSEAVENALKIARSATNRRAIISFEGGHHGRTAGALSVTNSRSELKRDIGAMVPGAFTLPYPTSSGAADDLARIFRTSCPSANVAAVIIEPVLGEGGYVACPTAYLRDLSIVCKKHGIMLIADEIQCGAARTGTFFAYQHAGIRPDIVTCAKGLASGMPLSAVLFRSSLEIPEHVLGGTFGGNEVSLAAAGATLDIINKNELAKRAVRTGDLLCTMVLHACARKHARVQLTGRGLMVGVHFEGINALTVMNRLYKQNVLVLPCGANALRLAPPLTVTRNEIDEFMSAFEVALVRSV